jgi:hypothetical protein
MNPKDIPPKVFVLSFLDSAAKVGIEAVVIYTVSKNGKPKTAASSNRGPEAIARAANTLKFDSGSIERSAMAMHAFRLPVPDDADEDMKAALSLCYICHLAEPWEKLDETDRHGHRVMAKVAMDAAVTAVATEPAVIV